MAKVPNELVLTSAVNPRRIEVVYEDDLPSMTRQEFAEECDINGIMKRYERTGMIPGNPNFVPQYLDLTVTPANLMDCMNQMIDADQAFMSLPATVRKEFDNDSMRFVEYASNPDNLGRMREWGLAPPEAPPEPIPLGSRENPISIVPADPPAK